MHIFTYKTSHFPLRREVVFSVSGTNTVRKRYRNWHIFYDIIGRFVGQICAIILQKEGFYLMEKTFDMSVNLNRLVERGIYETFHVDGNEDEVLTDSYFELYRLLGTEGMLMLYKHYHGDKIFPQGFIPGDYSIP